MRSFIYAHIHTTHILTMASIDAHIRTTHIQKLATSIMASSIYARICICTYTNDTYKCASKCAFMDDNFLKCVYMEERIYGKCI